MTVTQATKVIRDAVQIVPVWRHLHAWVISCTTRRRRFLNALAHVWREWWWHVVRKIEALKGEIDRRFNLVCEMSLDGEALEVDQQDGW